MIYNTSFRTARQGLMTASALALLVLATPVFAATSTFPNNVVSQTTTLDSLTIAEGQVLTAPEGKSLTLTVDGVNVAPRPGTYTGKVVLSVTDTIVVPYRDLTPHSFRAGLYIDDNRVVPSKSVTAAVSGQIGEGAASDVKIVSRDELFNGVLITGDSKYTIDGLNLDMTGNGGDDFAGWGAALMTTGHADVTVNNAKIHTKGAVRTAVFIGGQSTLRLNNCDVYTESGTLPADYVENLKLGYMKEVPWQLSLSGNVRSTNLVDGGTVYYTNCHMRSSGWGVLSVDDTSKTRMYVKDSLIETFNSGYGAYSIGDSIDTFDHSTLNVADYALIIAGRGSAVFTNGTVVNSRRFGAMIFDHDGGGNLQVEKGTIFNTRSTGFLFKGRGGRMTIDGAEVRAGNGIILQAMIEDNPRKVEQKLAAEKKAAEAAATAAAAPAGAAPIVGERTINPMGQDVSFDVTANLRQVDLRGDFLNTRTQEGGLIVNFDHAIVHGAISTGVQKPISDMPLVRATFWQIAEVTNTLQATPEKNGATASIGEGSTWVVTKTSYLTRLDIARGGKVVAPEGYHLTLKVDGKPTVIKAGSTSGALVLAVAPN